MSASICWRMEDGKEGEDLYPTDEAAKQALDRILEKHREMGRRITVQAQGQELSPQYTVTDVDGYFVAKYQIFD